jgi:hypothetical protein
MLAKWWKLLDGPIFLSSGMGSFDSGDASRCEASPTLRMTRGLDDEGV